MVYKTIGIIIAIIVLISIFTTCKCKEFFPYFNAATRNTRGMSYDIRCTPKIPRVNYGWNYGTLYPNHYGKCLDI